MGRGATKYYRSMSVVICNQGNRMSGFVRGDKQVGMGRERSKREIIRSRRISDCKKTWYLIFLSISLDISDENCGHVLLFILLQCSSYSLVFIG